MFSVAAAAAKWRTDQFLNWNATTEAFETGFTARLFRVDRFKSIYTRPVHRRQITIDPGTTMPTSMVVQRSLTGDVYMVSDLYRQDAWDESEYDGIVTLHLASDSSGGMASLRRYELQGTGDNLGPLVQTTIGNVWIDLELRTASADPDMHDEFIGHYFLTCPMGTDIQKDDYVILSGTQYRVDETYSESGYRMARVAKEDYDKSDLTYHLPTGIGGSYDAATGVITDTTTVDRIFSAAVTKFYSAELEETLAEGSSHQIFIGYTDIGFTPKIDELITYAGIEYKITSVGTNSDKQQWEIIVRSI